MVEKTPMKDITIVQVYRTQYKDGKAKGLGDFLRGYGCLLQLRRTLGFKVEVDMRDHPLADHLDSPASSPDVLVDYGATSVCPHINYVASAGWAVQRDPEFLNGFCDWLAETIAGTAHTSVVPVFVTAYPVADLEEEDKKIIRQCVRPSPKTARIFEDQSPLQPYAVLHLRSGDNVVVEGEAVDPRIVSCLTEVSSAMDIGDVFLADTRALDSVVSNSFGLITTETAPVHLSDSPKEDLLKRCVETLYDWWLLSRAARIVAVSVYYWGSGFSSQASIIYNVPLEKYIMWQPTGYTLHHAPA